MLSYDYNVLTEEQAQRARFGLLPDGEYNAFVTQAVGKPSGKGNAMVELTLQINHEGVSYDVKDFLLFTDNMIWKTKHFCESAGLVQEFIAKKFRPEMAPRKNVRVIIKTQAGKEIPLDKLNGKAPGTKYFDKNSVEDYLSTKLDLDMSIPANDDLPFNDDIPL